MEVKESKEMILFENKKIRRQEYNGEWYYAVVDIIEVLTDSKDPQSYWRKLKQRLYEEGNQSVTICHELKIPSKKIEREETFELSDKIRRFKTSSKDGKNRLTDCANRETIFRII